MTDSLGGVELLDRLKQVARNGQSIDIAQIQFVGLEEVRAAYGERWPKERARIQEVARGFVGKRLRREDVLIPCENGFVIVFGNVDSVDTALTAHAVGHSLRSFFTGEQETRNVSVDVVHESVSAKDLPRFLQGLSRTDISAARRGDVPPGGADPSAFSLRFQPLWDVSNEAVAAYFAEAVDPASGDRIRGYHFEADAPSPSRLLEIDEITLRASETAMRAMFNSGRKAMLGVSLHVSSLMKVENRSRLLHVISNLDKELCKYRAVRLSGVGPGFPRLYLRDTVGFLRARLPRVFISMNAMQDDFTVGMESEAGGLCFTWPPSARIVDASGFPVRLHRTAASLHARSKRVIVEGPLTQAQARQSAAAGVHALASPLIWPPGKFPDGAVRWPASRLVGRGSQQAG
jgi:hypothetical protein